ncbi:MAG: decarboxylating NADP(+)-dependent phosphogluconate dehydrogenase [Anaerolineae bacterium]|jgi:6-phosphogluconate dehydrogenase|nr:decarboxylating NADP(+)-dependent phosphogluconate dehydrogenase [Anaerolineae bacterium]
MSQADIAMIGLAVMGQNLVMNMADHGFTVVAYNRTTKVVDDFVDGPAKGMSILPAHSLEEMVSLLKRPRRVMLLVKAGQPVDDFIERLIPLLEPGDGVNSGDVIIDGGNSNYEDTIRRTKYLESKGLLFIGSGVSGGEEGARHGPSLMPGGSKAAWPAIKPIFQAVAAKVADGTPCCDWVGGTGAGHFVKMVHNGIEYGDMQIIAEAYQLMKEGLGLTNDEMAEVFTKWNEGPLDSYLIEITRDILAYKDEKGEATVDYILDSAGQKGTGKWTVSSALDQGTPLTLVGEAVFARFLSALVDERAAAAKVLCGANGRVTGDREAFLADLEKAVYAAKIVSYAQGYMLMRAAAGVYGWDLNLGGIALMWRGGCIIRSVFLGKIKDAFDADPNLPNLLLNPYFQQAMAEGDAAWRRVVSTAVQIGVPVPTLSSSLAFYDGYRRERLPANLTQAQRDYFGAHTYERVDTPRGQFFHTNWTGQGGDVTSRAYQA